MNVYTNSAKTDSKRHFDSIDYMKGIGIFLVVLGYVILLSDNDNSVYLNLTKWIYSFHMPLFFIISGMGLGLKFRLIPINHFY